MAEKMKRRKVVEVDPQGCGVFHYKLSCGHSASRVGVVPRGRVMEQPARTVVCYECSDRSTEQVGA